MSGHPMCFSKHKHGKHRRRNTDLSKRKKSSVLENDLFPDAEEKEDPEDVDIEFIGDIKISTIIEEEEKTKDVPTVKKAPRDTSVIDYSGYDGCWE